MKRIFLMTLMSGLPLTAHAGDPVDEWVRNCNQSQGLAYCQEKAKRLGDSSNSNATTVKLFNGYGSAMQNSLDAMNGFSGNNSGGASLSSLIGRYTEEMRAEKEAAGREELRKIWAQASRNFMDFPTIWSSLLQGAPIAGRGFDKDEVARVIRELAAMPFPRERNVALLRNQEIGIGLLRVDGGPENYVGYQSGGSWTWHGDEDGLKKIVESEKPLKGGELFTPEALFVLGWLAESRKDPAQAVTYYEQSLAYMRMPNLRDGNGNRVASSGLRTLVYATAALERLYRSGATGVPADAAKADALLKEAATALKPHFSNWSPDFSPDRPVFVSALVRQPALLALLSGKGK